MSDCRWAPERGIASADLQPAIPSRLTRVRPGKEPSHAEANLGQAGFTQSGEHR
jgi:hypothetical protein